MAMDKAHVLQIQNTLETLLDQLQMPFSIREYDQELHDACLRGAQERGISLQGPAHIGIRLPVGVVMASIAYGHLPDPLTRVYIALYTAGLTSLEDVCGNDTKLLSAFCERFFKSISHGHPVMDACDLLLRELPLHFDHVPADMMLLSSMDSIVANILEYEMQRNPISPSAQQFPFFLRNLTSLARPHSLFAFPKSMPFTSYIEAIPAMVNYISFINDTFSFYKEELANENVNCISNIARCTGQTKLDVLQHLADESVKAHKEILAVLKDRPQALAAYQAFAMGIVHYHTSTKRYKLTELWTMAADAEKPPFTAPPRSKPVVSTY
ncbi:hypothetical protein APHAL10511_005343 [Amanita phalloides]|nr:hypothetical protein APHAL10511_005343 [Amanita phalloides]